MSGISDSVQVSDCQVNRTVSGFEYPGQPYKALIALNALSLTSIENNFQQAKGITVKAGRSFRQGQKDARYAHLARPPFRRGLNANELDSSQTEANDGISCGTENTLAGWNRGPFVALPGLSIVF